MNTAIAYCFQTAGAATDIFVIAPTTACVHNCVTCHTEVLTPYVEYGNKSWESWKRI